MYISYMRSPQKITLSPSFTLPSCQVQWNAAMDGVTLESKEDTFVFRFTDQTYNQ